MQDSFLLSADRRADRQLQPLVDRLDSMREHLQAIWSRPPAGHRWKGSIDGDIGPDEGVQPPKTGDRFPWGHSIVSKIGKLLPLLRSIIRRMQRLFT